MKIICLISHEVPLEEGKFLRYEAGKEYELKRYPEVYFSPVYTREERDEIINDKGEITGTEHGTDQEVGISSVK